MTHRGGRLTMVVRDAPLNRVLSEVAEACDLNVVFSSAIAETVSITLQDVELEVALTSILSVVGYQWSIQQNIIYVTSTRETLHLPAHVHGRRMRVFPLDYILAADALQGIEGLLSPMGKVYAVASSPMDNRKSREAIAVEDLPPIIARVEDYLLQMDRPPRQVLIEVRVLKVNLKDNLNHGVNLDQMMRMSGSPVHFKVSGFANAGAPMAGFLTIDGTDLDGLVEALHTTGDAKTLASPRVTVLNGQEARIQVGEQLGFRVTTTTETSTLESVEFIDVGVVLRVTPRISRDGRVIMRVKPEVSSGRVNADTGLPEEETTEVETDIMLSSGQGMVIGGLIQEEDVDSQTKVPYLGDLWLIGKLFGRTERVKERSEIIIALVPYVVPLPPHVDIREQINFERAMTPILDPGLSRLPRPWEPRLPSSDDKPSCFLPRRRGVCYESVAPTLAEPPYSDQKHPGEAPAIAPPVVLNPAQLQDARRRQNVSRLPAAGPVHR